MKKLIVMLSLLSVLLVSAAVAAPKDIKLPPVGEHMLDNGLKVYIVETREVPLVTIRLLVPAGAAADPEGKRGLAGLTATMILRGAGGIGAEEMAESIESVGGSLESAAGRDLTQIYGDFMARDFELGVDLLAKTVMRPDFPQEEFDREKGIVTADLMGQKENPYGVASRVFLEQLLGDHPYAMPTDGYLDTVEKISRGDVAGFHADNYVPEGCLLVVVGDIDADKAMKSIRKKFDKWSGSRKVEKSCPPVEKKKFPGCRVVVIDKPDVTQSQIRIGNAGVPMNTPDYFALEVANTILGGGFTSRLMNEIRVNRGLSYGARSRMNKLRHGGYFGVYTYTKNESLRECIDVALDEITKMRDVAVEAEELEGAERYISGLFPFELETNSDLARWMMNIAFYGLDKDFVENYRSGIDAVTSGEVQRVAKEYFHSTDNIIVLLTNYEETAGQLEGLGKIEVISFDDIR